MNLIVLVSYILESECCNLEYVNQAELNANGRCADWDENPVALKGIRAREMFCGVGKKRV